MSEHGALNTELHRLHTAHHFNPIQSQVSCERLQPPASISISMSFSNFQIIFFVQTLVAQWHSHSLCTMALQDTVTVAVAECHQMVNGEVTVSQSLQSSKVKTIGILGIPMESLGLVRVLFGFRLNRNVHST